jgi:hypothetical protein
MDVQTLIIVAGLSNSVATIATIVIFIWGIWVLAFGRFNSRGTQLRGPTARIAGLFLALQLPLAVFFNWVLYNAPSHGDQVSREINRGIVSAIVWGLFAVGGVICAKMYARANVPAGGESGRATGEPSGRGEQDR